MIEHFLSLQTIIIFVVFFAEINYHKENTLKTCTSAIAALLMYKSAQRPRAIAGATLEEFGAVMCGC